MHNSIPPDRCRSRRNFIAQSALASSALFLSPAELSRGEEKFFLPMVVFSKCYQALNLNFADAAALTAEAGLNGVDPTVRAGGEVLPERAVEELPRYAEALSKLGLQLPYITSGITSIASPQAEEILRAAKRLGVKFYRLGFIEHQPGVAFAQQLAQIRAALRDLAALNHSIGITAVFQNHSGNVTVGGDLEQLRQIVSGFDPAQIGVAFDIGHALVVHGDGWRPHFDKLKSQIQVAYVKDVTRAGQWVRFGEGEIGRVGYFKLLRQMGYREPIELHVEFDWSEQGKAKNRAALLKALKASGQVLKRWVTES